MTKTKFLIAAAISFGLAGCGSMGSNTTVYSSNQPVVERTNYAIDVNAGGSGGIAQDEKVRVNEWMDALQLGYGDRVSVDYGASYANSAVQNDVVRMAADRGMLIADTAPVTPGTVIPGTVRIIVTRSKASVPNCPNWSKSTEANYNSSTHPNYGCGVNSTMAAMIADPEDLVRGKENESLDGTSGKRAIETYRTRTGDQQ